MNFHEKSMRSWSDFFFSPRVEENWYQSQQPQSLPRSVEISTYITCFWPLAGQQNKQRTTAGGTARHPNTVSLSYKKIRWKKLKYIFPLTACNLNHPLLKKYIPKMVNVVTVFKAFSWLLSSMLGPWVWLQLKLLESSAEQTNKQKGDV